MRDTMKRKLLALALLALAVVILIVGIAYYLQTVAPAGHALGGAVDDLATRSAATLTALP